MSKGLSTNELMLFWGQMHVPNCRCNPSFANGVFLISLNLSESERAARAEWRSEIVLLIHLLQTFPVVVELRIASQSLVLPLVGNRRWGRSTFVGLIDHVSPPPMRPFGQAAAPAILPNSSDSCFML
jgi:hypothetical protein